MLEMQLRQAATVLLESAIRIAPADTRDWGRAMMGELNYVEGPWAGAMWALGSSSVLAKQALASLILPSSRGQDFIPDGGLFAKSAALRKAALAIGGACVLVALLFFAAPPFRQAFGVAMKPWFVMYQAATGNSQPGIAALAKRVERQHDAEGLAFCAVRIQDPRESPRLAEEAVRLDPNLLWVYALVALRHPELPETSEWIEKLQRWDPPNGLIPLITAESIVRTHFPHGVWAPPNQQQDQAWRSAISEAFQSPKFDDYLDRFAGLNRKVVPRYHFYDPYEVESRWEFGLPESTFESCERFALSLIRSGQELESHGDWKSAREKYWAVAHFGQLIDSQGHAAFEHQNGAYLQSLAYRPLKGLSVKEGNQAEAALFGYLSEKFNPLKGMDGGVPGESAFGEFTSQRNAAVVEISGLMILVFSGLVVIAALILIAASLPTARSPAQRAKPVATIVVLTSSVGLLFSSVTLYLTYRPYWYIFQRAVQGGDRVQTHDLNEFLRSTQMLPGVSPHAFGTLMEALLYSGSPGFLFYFWAGVTLLGLLGLGLILFRHFLGRPRAHAP